MAAIIYGLCMVTALTCACMLLRAYLRGRYRLLLWSGLGFIGLTLNNLVLALDKLVFTFVDLTAWRTAIALISFIIILWGLVWDAE
jgi:hypothetical protein